MTLPTSFDTFHCGKLLDSDAELAAATIARFGGVAKATRKSKGVVLLVGYFPNGLTHSQRIGIASAMGNEGIFAL